MKAAEADSLMCVTFLLKQNANPMAIDEYGRTARDYAKTVFTNSQITEKLELAEEEWIVKTLASSVDN